MSEKVKKIFILKFEKWCGKSGKVPRKYGILKCFQKILRKMLTKQYICDKIEIVKVIFISSENSFHKLQKYSQKHCEK